MNKYQATKQQTEAYLRAERPRLGDYALAVLDGNQMLSGSDLLGKARQYGGWYHKQRAMVLTAWVRCGGTEIYLDHNRRELAVHVGMDDYGNQLYEVEQKSAGGYSTVRTTTYKNPFGQCAVMRTAHQAARI